MLYEKITEPTFLVYIYFLHLQLKVLADITIACHRSIQKLLLLSSVTRLTKIFSINRLFHLFNVLRPHFKLILDVLSRFWVSLTLNFVMVIERFISPLCSEGVWSKLNGPLSLCVMF